MRRWLAWLSVLIVSPCAWAQDEINDALADFSHLQADFVQERHLSDMPSPLRASGRLLLSRAHGVWWRQEEPFGMTLILTEQSMTQQIDGEAPQSLTAADERMQQFQRILQELLLVDLEALEDSFELNPQPTAEPGTWALQLRPTATPLDRLFTAFEISGDSVVRELLMRDTDGGRTRIRFSRHQLDDGPLTDDERARFDQ